MFFCLFIVASMRVTAASEQCCKPIQVVQENTMTCVDRGQDIELGKIEFPGCHHSVKIVELKETSITEYGGLKYKEIAIPKGQFCFGLTSTDVKVVAMCGTCLTKPCVQLCCPLDHVRVEQVNWEQPRCPISEDLEPPGVCFPTPSTSNQGNGTFLHGMKHFHYVENNNESGHFKCEGDKTTSDSGLIPVELLQYTEHHITEDGMMQASYLGEDGENIVQKFSSKEFCLELKQTNSSHLDQTFLVCIEEQHQQACPGEEFTRVFYPSALFISSVFFFFTILYFIKDLGVNCPMIKKIYLGFVINNFVVYICIALTYVFQNFAGVLLGGSNICSTVGYITLYFFTSLFLWINSMAANIFFRLSSFEPQHSETESSNFIYYIAYAQGSPLLLCAFIALMDNYGSCNLILPNMGEAHCFIGSPWSSQRNDISHGRWYAFFFTPEFIYFHSIILLLQSANIVFFIMTVYSLVKNWRSMADVISIETKRNFLIVLKLFFITGIPWAGEFISHLITHIEGHCKYFEYRLILDLLNLFSGFTVFIIFVLKPRELRKMVIRMSFRSQLSNSSNSSRLSSRTPAARERKTTRETLIVQEDIEMDGK